MPSQHSNTPSFRPLNPEEKQILDKLLETDFPGRDAIRAQIANCKVEEWADGSRSLKFQTQSDQNAHVVDRVPVEGYVDRKNGGPLDILLHVLGGKIKYLEFITYHLPNLSTLPAPSMIRVSVRQPTD
jgi:hypothetical protein